MLKRPVLIFIFFCLSITLIPGVCLAKDVPEIEAFNKDDRILILAPHPDDEAICCSGIIRRAVGSGAQIQIVYLSNGDNNQFAFIVYEKRITFRKGEFLHMGEVRRLEAIRAMKSLGVPGHKLIFLGYPDAGTFAIFTRCWQTKKPFRSMLTRVSSVPYKKNFSFGAPYVGESILKDLENILVAYRPTKIFVSHPADVNPDHKALYLFLQVALRDLRGKIPQSKVYPYLVHCAGWPRPRHYHPELNLEPPKNLLGSGIQWVKLDLNPWRLEKKHQAILYYKSQTHSSAFYLLSFARKNELFGDYPEIELSRQVSLKERAPVFFGSSRMFAGASGEFDFSAAALAGAEGVSYAVADNAFLIRIEKKGSAIRKYGFMTYIFGYSDKKPFASMPKIRIFTRRGTIRAYEGNKRIDKDGIGVELGQDTLILRIPMSILGDPDFMLISIKSYGGKLPVDTTGFRRIVIK